MIAKRVTKKETANFKVLAGYVLGEKNGGRGDPLDWKLGEYVLDQTHAGEKVVWAHSTNCENTEDLGWAVKEIQTTQAMNKTARTDKSYHLVVSFPTGERPTREQMEDIERELCASIGFGEHQRVAAVHQNTDNWHMHIAINRVHPKTFRALEPYRDHYKLQEACAALEIKHNLQREMHTTSSQQSKASQTNGQATDMEAHAGKLSFSRWVMENAAEAITQRVASASSWGEVHAVMEDYGLVIRPRGAGLVVASQTDTRSAMKASAIDRSLSFKTLADRFGEFEPARPSGAEPTMRYTGEPRGADPGLWARYQKERQRAAEAREAALTSLRAGHLKHIRELNEWYRGRYAAARAQHLNRADRTSTRAVLESEFAADHAKRKAREAEERKIVKADHQIPKWEDFLAREGGRGDAAAIRTLQRRVEALIRADIDLARTDQNRDQAGRSMGRD